MSEIYFLPFDWEILKKAKDFLDSKKDFIYYPISTKNRSLLKKLKPTIYYFSDKDFSLISLERLLKEGEKSEYLISFFSKKEKYLKKIFKIQDKINFLASLISLSKIPILPKIIEKDLMKEKKIEELIKKTARFVPLEKKEKEEIWERIREEIVKKTTLNPQDMIILILAICGKIIITRLMKYLFLLKEELNIDKYLKNYYQFAPYSLGPFDKRVYDHLKELIKKGLVKKVLRPKIKILPIEKEIISYFEEGEIIPEYLLNEKGMKRANEIISILNKIDKNLIKEIEKIKRRYQRYNLLKLLKHIYEKYPAYQKKSKVWEKIKEA